MAHCKFYDESCGICTANETERCSDVAGCPIEDIRKFEEEMESTRDLWDDESYY